MSVTRRFATIAAIGVPLLFVGLFVPTLGILIFVLYNIILFALLIMDYVMSPTASSFILRRIDPNTSFLDVKEQNAIKLSHKAINKIAFMVYNNTDYKLHIEATDTISGRFFKINKEDLQHIVFAGEEKQFTYSVTPAKRGVFTFTNVHLKVQGILGLALKYHIYSLPMEFKVYPNLQDLGRFRLMIQKSRLLPLGEKPLKILGTGTEFESLRAYVEGDDYRKINWPVTARENRLIVNDYQIEKNQPVFIMIDGGRPMSYTVKGYKKLDYAINAALVLSDIVNQKGDQSGLVVFDKSVRSLISPGKGEIHRNSLMETLYRIQETKDTSNYGAVFRTLCERQKRRSLVFIFTDFETLEEATELTSHISALKRRHFPIVIFMKDEKLIALTKSTDSYVKEVAESFLLERKKLFRMLSAMSIPNVETEAENFSVTAVNQYLKLKRV